MYFIRSVYSANSQRTPLSMAFVFVDIRLTMNYGLAELNI